jgi:hypothetical protein
MADNQATNDNASASPGERDLLLGDGPSRTVQTKAATGHQPWVCMPTCGWIPAVIFMFGSSADFCDGSSFGAGFKDIGGLYGQSKHAAWLLVAYQTTFMMAQPWYSVASTRYSWTGPLLIAYLLFAVGLLIGAFTGPPDTKGDSIRDIVPLLISRAVTAWGACAMVYVPNLVFNSRSDPAATVLGLLSTVAVPEDQRALWVAVQALFDLAGQYIGRGIGGSGISDGDQLQR